MTMMKTRKKNPMSPAIPMKMTLTPLDPDPTVTRLVYICDYHGHGALK